MRYVLKMKKTDLVIAFAKAAHITEKQSEQIISITFESMIKSLYDDDRIEIRGFGSFMNRNYKAYEGRNPKTGKIVKVPPKKVPFYKVGKDLQKTVNDNKDKYTIRDA